MLLNQRIIWCKPMLTLFVLTLRVVLLAHTLSLLLKDYRLFAQLLKKRTRHPASSHCTDQRLPPLYQAHWLRLTTRWSALDSTQSAPTSSSRQIGSRRQHFLLYPQRMGSGSKEIRCRTSPECGNSVISRCQHLFVY